MTEGYLYGQVGKIIITNYDTRHLVKFPNIVKKNYMDTGASGEPVPKNGLSVYLGPYFLIY